MAYFYSATVAGFCSAVDNLDDIGKILEQEASPAAKELADERKKQGLCFFTIEDGTVVRLSPAKLCKRGQRWEWKYPADAGRRWLRSILTGLVPPEALAAQFGHVQRGLDPWADTSALDPHLVRRALSKAVPELLDRAGFIPYPDGAVSRREAPRMQAKGPPPSPLPPSSISSPERPEATILQKKCGAILASAI